jgi:predicted TIM-barrel fold metal-dependent hydrolase
MTLIALEEHVLPAELINEVWPDSMGSESLTAKLADIGEQRLPAMDEAGIEMQVLSVVAPGSQQVPAEPAVHLSRALNDRCAEIVAAHPIRFSALATLPTQDSDAAIVEAKRAITELGFCGVVINGHTHGRFLDAPEFDELLTAIEELDVPIYLHPTYPPPEVAGVYFGDLPESTGRALATAAWGWHAETGLHVLRLAAAGVFSRHPKLQIVVGHMGENLQTPFSPAPTPTARQWRRPSANTYTSPSAATPRHRHCCARCRCSAPTASCSPATTPSATRFSTQSS